MTKSSWVGVHEAKTHLSQLLERVAAGEEVGISRRGQLVAKLVPAHSGPSRVFGIDRGRFTVPEDFDAPLATEMLSAFEA